MMCPWVTKGTGFVKYVLQNVEKRHEMLVYLTRDYIIETREINLRTNMCHLRALGLQNMCFRSVSVCFGLFGLETAKRLQETAFTLCFP